MARILLLSSQPILSGGIIKDLLEKGGADLAKIDVITNSGTLKPSTLSKEAYVAVFAFAEEADLHSTQFLTSIHGCLAPGGAVTMVEKAPADTKALEKKLLLSGFSECKVATTPSGDAMVEARKPKWTNQQGQSIKLKGVNGTPAAANGSSVSSGANGNSGAAQKSSWSLGAGDLDDEAVIDDDELLLDEDKERPAAYDCGVSTTKKACKDCTCGRAEGQKVEVKLTQEMLENPTSGCGSCGLGDAFRCGGCPYRGLPTFEMGKKIELPSDFLTADI